MVVARQGVYPVGDAAATQFAYDRLKEGAVPVVRLRLFFRRLYRPIRPVVVQGEFGKHRSETRSLLVGIYGMQIAARNQAHFNRIDFPVASH